MWLHTRCLLDWLPHRLAWVALLLGLSSGLALAVPQCELNGEPVSPSNGHTTAGKSGLMRCTDDSGPIRLREQTLRDGRFEGPARFVMQSGERREYNVNARGNREGVFREWDASGTLSPTTLPCPELLICNWARSTRARLSRLLRPLPVAWAFAAFTSKPWPSSSMRMVSSVSVLPACTEMVLAWACLSALARLS